MEAFNARISPDFMSNHIHMAEPLLCTFYTCPLNLGLRVRVRESQSRRELFSDLFCVEWLRYFGCVKLSIS